jgi:hypothetical protein
MQRTCSYGRSCRCNTGGNNKYKKKCAIFSTADWISTSTTWKICCDNRHLLSYEQMRYVYVLRTFITRIRTRPLSMVQHEQKTLDDALPTATQEPPEEYTVLITNTFWSVVYDVTIILISEIPNFPSERLIQLRSITKITKLRSITNIIWKTLRCLTTRNYTVRRTHKTVLPVLN